MADDKRPVHAAPDGQTDLDALYSGAHKAFMNHVKDCRSCRTRGIGCVAVGPIKERLGEARSASIAARSASR